LKQLFLYVYIAVYIMFDPLTNINQKNFLLILYVVTLCVFAPGIYYVSNRHSQEDSSNINSVEQRISLGNKILVTAHNSLAKQTGVSAFEQGDYAAAIDSFRLALKEERNDPEARIYLNNAIAAKTKDNYRIAVSVPIGGNLATAQEILRGVAQAQDQVNRQGGIDGKLMMVEITNDDNDPKIAQEIANKLVVDKKVLAVVGHNDSDASIAAAPIYEKNGLVMITPTSSAETLATPGDYIFRSTPSTRDLAETLAQYVVKVAEKENIAMCIDSDSQVSTSFQENFTWAVYNYGAKINPLECDLAVADFMPTKIPSQAISMGADALVLAPSVLQAGEAMEVVKANDDRLTLFGNHSMTSYQTLKEGQKDANGMILTVAWYPPESANPFTKDAQTLWGGAVNWRTAMAYDATQSISQAIAEPADGIASSAERQSIQKTLANPEFSAQGATSDVNFLPSGDRNLRGTLVKIQPSKKSKSGTGYDFVPLDRELTSNTTK
jgi:branched-chain amino acid transport system substrate-binding protein